MLNHFSIRQRMYIIVISFFILFIYTIWFAVKGANNVKKISVSSTSNVMLEDQKDKIKIATHSTALSIGNAIRNIDEQEKKIDAIRLYIDDIRFEKDGSGYYFVYQGTTNIALPTNKTLQGKNLGDLKDKNGVYLVREMKEKASSGGGFVKYVWPKPDAGDVPKLSYAEMIPGTDFWIGTGVYLDNIKSYTDTMEGDINSKVKSMTLRIVATAATAVVPKNWTMC